MDKQLIAAIEHLHDCLREAENRGISEARAATLSTVGQNGLPSSWIIMLTSIDVSGLLFFTNTRSGKAVQMDENPQAALCFFWRALRQQVTLEGAVQLLSEEESDQHWKRRYRDAALGAWASEQVSDFQGTAQLKEGLRRYRREFSDEFVPRPAHWRGYKLMPRRIEFWQSGWERLRPRILYFQDDNRVWQRAQENP